MYFICEYPRMFIVATQNYQVEWHIDVRSNEDRLRPYYMTQWN